MEAAEHSPNPVPSGHKEQVAITHHVLDNSRVVDDPVRVIVEKLSHHVGNVIAFATIAAVE